MFEVGDVVKITRSFWCADLDGSFHVYGDEEGVVIEQHSQLTSRFDVRLASGRIIFGAHQDILERLPALSALAFIAKEKK